MRAPNPFRGSGRFLVSRRSAITFPNFDEIERRVREDERAHLDAFKRGAGQAPVLYRASSDAVKVGDADKPLEFVANEESEDHAGDVVLATAWELDTFKKNPVMPWVHDYRLPPIGRWQDVSVQGKQLVGRAVFDRGDPFASAIEAKYRSQFLRAVSVGFRAHEFEEREGGRGLTFKRVELLEISAVPIGMHPAALRKGLALLEEAPVWIFMPGDRGEFRLSRPGPTVRRDMGGMRSAMDDMEAALSRMRDEMDDVSESASSTATSSTATSTNTVGSVTITVNGGPKSDDNNGAAGRPSGDGAPPSGGGDGKTPLSGVLEALRRVREEMK